MASTRGSGDGDKGVIVPISIKWTCLRAMNSYVFRINPMDDGRWDVRMHGHGGEAWHPGALGFRQAATKDVPAAMYACLKQAAQGSKWEPGIPVDTDSNRDFLRNWIHWAWPPKDREGTKVVMPGLPYETAKARFELRKRGLVWRAKAWLDDGAGRFDHPNAKASVLEARAPIGRLALCVLMKQVEARGFPLGEDKSMLLHRFKERPRCRGFWGDPSETWDVGVDVPRGNRE